MKKRILALLLTAALLLTPALAYGGGAVYSHSTELADGFSYSNAVSYDGEDRYETYVLENRPGSAVYPVYMACDTIYGGFDLNEMLAYAESRGLNVVAAVNADFGEYTGVPTGMVVENGVYKSSPEGNNAVGFDSGRAYISAKPEVTLEFENEDGFSYSTAHLNKSRTGYGAYVFSEYFSTVSTRTSGGGWFVRFEVARGEDLALGGEVELTVTGISSDGGAVPIGEDNLVLTASDSADLGWLRDAFAVGDRVTLTVSCPDEELAACDYVSGGGDLLAVGGRLTDSEKWNSSITGTHPRTALGVKRDGSVVYYVLDGRGAHSAGATLEELAADMLELGCVDIINLDGGGSSVMALRLPGSDGLAVVNEPSDGKLRDVASYILFVTDAAGGGAQRVYLDQAGAYVLAGSSIELGFSAQDRGLRAAELPGAVSASAQRGSVSGNVYTAPESACTDTVSFSSGGLRGSGELYIIDRADSLSVTDAATGEEIERLLLDAGESVQLEIGLSRYMREVLCDLGEVSFSLGGDVGAVDANGLFTAALAPASGELKIECAGLERVIPVQVAFEFSDMRGHWASGNVKRLYEQGVVTGVSAAEFGPNLSMKRCDFVLMLYRAAGEPAVDAAGSAFGDVPADSYFASAVAWAAANGITQGKSEGVFAPYDTLSREEGFTFLYRALNALDVDHVDADPALLASFPDGSAVSDWARVPTATLVGMGVVSGGDSGLSPHGSLSRAEMAKLLDTAING